jgi:hypothetical protein
MSFYNVTNPTSFSVVSDTRKSLVNPGKLTRSSAIQVLNPFTGNSSGSPITAEQLIQGVLFVNPDSNPRSLYLPTASNLIQLLMGPGGYDVSVNDIFTLRIINTNAGGNAVAVTVNTGGSGGPISVAAGVQRLINIQLTNVTSGSYAYSIF